MKLISHLTLREKNELSIKTGIDTVQIFMKKIVLMTLKKDILTKMFYIFGGIKNTSPNS